MINELTILATCRRLRKNAWMDRSEIEKVQQKKLRALINHAYRNVPYYHQLFDSSGIKPEDIGTVDDLSKIPITTKTQMKSAGVGVLARNISPKKRIEQSTSGSTGEPFRIFHLKRDWLIKMATYRRVHVENGLQPYKDVVLAVTAPKNIPKNKKWYRRFIKGRYISVWDDIQKQVSTLKEVNPDVINGYGSAIKILALAAQEMGVTGIKPKLIITGSDTMDKESRTTIESAFGANPIDTYNAIETGCMAWECGEHIGYHINIDTCAMEFIKDAENVADGEMGEIVLTDLNSYAMPFIRYSIGDLGIPSAEQCGCGRGLPLMKQIVGRVDDIVKLPNGRTFSPRGFTAFMRQFSSSVSQFRIIQEKKTQFTMELVAGRSFSESTLYQLDAKFKEFLGADIQLNVTIVDEITREKSGKIRSIISKVKTNERGVYGE